MIQSRPRRPKVDLKINAYEKSLEILAGGLLVTYWAYILCHYYGFINDIGLFFKLPIESDNFKNDGQLLTFPKSVTAIYLFITLLSLFPYSFNFLTTITQENAEAEYRKATNSLRYLKIIIVLIYFLFSLHYLVDSLEAKKILIVLVILLVPILTLVAFTYPKRRND